DSGSGPHSPAADLPVESWWKDGGSCRSARCAATRPRGKTQQRQGDDEGDSAGAVLATRGHRTELTPHATTADRLSGPRPVNVARKNTGMMLEFTVGINIAGKRESVTVAAEDALIAELKYERPDAVVRRRNKRGDLRHPHRSIAARAE